MSVLVVDAGVVAKWFLPERLWMESRSLLHPRHDLACPDLLWRDMGRVLSKKTRRGEIHPRDAVRILRTIDELPLAVYSSQCVVEGAFEVAHRTDLAVDDCIYVALAIALEGRLATADERLVRSLAGTPLAANVVWLGDATDLG